MRVSRPLILSLLIAFASAPVWAGPCPGTAAKLKVIISNPTSSNVQVTISGRVIAGKMTCTDRQDQYSKTVTLSAFQELPVAIPDSGGLNTGLWVHQITTPIGQYQHQKSTVLYTTDVNQYATIRWKYYQSVFTVRTRGDASGTCGATNCTFRQALAAANSAPKPALVQFAISPGPMVQTANLSVSSSVTIDGTNSNGSPFIVGDPSAALEAARAIDLKNLTKFALGSSDDIILKGLAISNTVAMGNPGAQLISGSGDNIRLETLRIDGGATGACTFPACPNGAGSDLIALTPGSGAVISKVEGRSAYGSGVVLDGGPHTIADSWFHHNYVTNVSADNTTLERNTIELAGRRLSNNVVVNSLAPGLYGEGLSELTTSRNVVRNNAYSGMEIPSTLFGVHLAHDYVCGNGKQGIDFTGGGPSDEATGTGLTAAYNIDHGLHFDTVLSGTLTFSNHNAFTANVSCGLRNESTSTVTAQNNQWRDRVPPTSCSGSPDWCQPQGSNGAIVCTNVQHPKNAQITIDSFSGGTQPTYPTNAIVTGQTVRVAGTGFNAIDGNPLESTGACTTEDLSAENCCLKKTKSNTCEDQTDPSVPPDPDQGNCVALMNAAYEWTVVPVTSVTPTTIVTEIVGDWFPCIGGTEMVRVVKLNSSGASIDNVGDYCLNQESF